MPYQPSTNLTVFAGRIVIRGEDLDRLLQSPAGPVYASLLRRTTRVQAKARELAHKRTGLLRRSIVKRLPAVTPHGGIGQLVGSQLYYALIHHEGANAHTIVPVNKQALAFTVVGGRRVIVKRVNHPGTTGTKYLVRALPEAAHD